jgi:hypothetical protein
MEKSRQEFSFTSYLYYFSDRYSNTPLQQNYFPESISFIIWHLVMPSGLYLILMPMPILRHNSHVFLRSLLTGLFFTATYYCSQAQLSADDISVIINKEVTQKRSPGIIVGTIDSTGKRQIISAGSYMK